MVVYRHSTKVGFSAPSEGSSYTPQMEVLLTDALDRSGQDRESAGVDSPDLALAVVEANKENKQQEERLDVLEANIQPATDYVKVFEDSLK